MHIQQDIKKFTNIVYLGSSVSITLIRLIELQ